jgi:hypothetical protein
LERHFGRVVTYEDVSYVAPGDIVDITRQVRRDGRMDRRVWGMRGESLSFIYRPTQESADVQLDEALAQLLTEWNGVGRTGEFRVEKVAGGHHVIPVARKGRDENVETYASPLETRITIPSRERSGSETMEVLTKAISESTRRPIFAGMMPVNRMIQSRIVIGAENQIAREVLWSAVQAIDPTLSWQMLCMVGENATCAFNVHSCENLTESDATQTPP